MAKDNHAFDRDDVQKHKKTSGTEDGQCLNRHIPTYRKSSCSHRFQAVERAANDDSSWYEGYTPVIQREGETLELYLKNFGVKTPKPGAWDVKGRNFKKAKHPYRNQAHHILPNGVLNGCLDEQTEDVDVKVLVRGGLLEAKYNLNHKINMIILPMVEPVAWTVNLPVHTEDAADRHAAYSKKVKTRVKKVVKEYFDLLDEPPEDHPEPPNQLAKKKLENISEKMRKAIRGWGGRRSKKFLHQMSGAHIRRFLR
jgi:hypothetical protein